jgi:predicted RNA binding protein YcfA (HicA-like mRNA interferase family)
MPKRYSSRQIQKVLERLGYILIRQKGSHAIFRISDGRVVVVQMNKKQIPPGTFSKILRDIDISQDEFENILD